MAIQEYLDVFDDNMKRIGSASRDEVHETGAWHQSFHCWIIRRSGEKRYLLFQRRGPQKKVYPNILDITAAGHLTVGESPAEGIRELNEELGLNKAISDLTYLGIRCDVAIIGSVTNREFCHTYLLESNIPLEDYRLQPDEVTGIVQIDIQDGIRLFAGEIDRIHASGHQVDEQGVKRRIEMEVSAKDIIPRVDRYYLKVCMMAERYFEGSPYLAI